MIPEPIGIATVGVALAGLALVLNRERRGEMRELRGEIKELREDTSQQFEAVRGEMAKLRERMARIEGMFEGFLRRESRQARESETAAA